MPARTPAKRKTGGARKGASLVTVVILPGVQVRLTCGRWARAGEQHELPQAEAKILVAQGVAELAADADRREQEAAKARPAYGRRLLEELERAVDEHMASARGRMSQVGFSDLRERMLRSRLEQLRASDREAWRAIREAIADREREPLGRLIRRLDHAGDELDGPGVGGLGRVSTPPPLLRDRSPSPG